MESRICADRASNVEPEEDDVSVLYLVVATLAAHLTGGASGLLAATEHQGLMRHRFGTNEAPLEVAVNPSRCLRRQGSARNGPGARFLGSDREKSLQIEKLVGGPDQNRQSRLVNAHVVKKLFPLRRRQLRDLGFQLANDDDDIATFLLRDLANARDLGRASMEVCFIDVGDEQHGFHG